MKKSRLDSALIAIAFGAFVALVLPLQTYLGNTSAYAYGAGRLVAEQTLVALVLAGAVWTLLRFIGERAGTALSALFTGILVCLYLESGPLAFGLPEIDGDLPDSLACVSRSVWDGAVWLAVIGTAVATCAFTRSWLHWVALAVLVMGGASLFDVRRDEAETDGAKRGGYEMSVDIIENVEYSPTRNVLLFVLDNVDTMVAADIVARDPELAAKFPGFCAFRNNVGMHDSTKLGVPGLMTGRYFEPGRGALAKYIMSVFGPDSFLETYKAHGDAIYAMFCTCSYGYTTAEIPPERRRAKAEARGPLVLRKTAEVPYLCLNDAVLFRALPFAFKRQFLSTKLRHRATVWSVDRNYDHENTVFPILARRPDGKFVFVKQYRKAAEEALIEVIAGGLEKGEDPEEGARRETAEETGYDVKSLRFLTTIICTPGYCEERIHIYFAELADGQHAQDQDPDENVFPIVLSEDEVEDGIRDGTIFDSKTLSAWACYRLM